MSISLSPAPAAKTEIDWSRIQSRLENLRVLRYEKERPQPGVIRVRIVLPTSDPTRGQPVVAEAQTEAAAILMALDAAEAWQRK